MPFTTLQNLAGLPTCTVRAGFDRESLPVGIQITGPRWSDLRVLAATQSFFAATQDGQDRWPEIG
jgi:Asp-tRNA(Asn)/Glu-tRNA(Gln) amidotransferase A subunit family amidase